MWNYKGVKITINSDNSFEYNFKDKCYKEFTLLAAKENIDSITKSYYVITESDYKNMLSKLDKRESDFVNAVITELSSHINSAYCEQGVNLDFEIEFLE